MYSFMTTTTATKAYFGVGVLMSDFNKSDFNKSDFNK